MTTTTTVAARLECRYPVLSVEWTAWYVVALVFAAGFQIWGQTALHRWIDRNELGRGPELDDVVRRWIQSRGHRSYWERWVYVADAFPILFAAVTVVVLPQQSVVTTTLYGLLMTFRVGLCAVTVMPRASRLDDKSSLSISQFHHDLILSGHTSLLTLCWWTWWADGWSAPWLVAWAVYVLVGSLLMVWNHEHYTVDIVLALVMASLVAFVAVEPGWVPVPTWWSRL